ncbi:hypothetical protein [Bradyrhizobium sp. USDA 4353]
MKTHILGFAIAALFAANANAGVVIEKNPDGSIYAMGLEPSVYSHQKAAGEALAKTTGVCRERFDRLTTATGINGFTKLLTNATGGITAGWTTSDGFDFEMFCSPEYPNGGSLGFKTHERDFPGKAFFATVQKAVTAAYGRANFEALRTCVTKARSTNDLAEVTEWACSSDRLSGTWAKLSRTAQR